MGIFVKRNFMGRKSIKKKAAPVLFPQEQSEFSFADLRIGTTLRIGRPSNRYYQYLFTSIDFLNVKLEDLSKLQGLEGTCVQVTGKIRLKDGNAFAIVQKEDRAKFFDKETRLFVDGQKALDRHELIFKY